jgi:predicted AAA+ superfamily ATPase
LSLAYWRTSTGLEVDLIVGKLELAIEIKASAKVGDARGLRALAEDQQLKRGVIVCLGDQPRRLADGIDIWPWQLFCQRLWAGEWF